MESNFNPLPSYVGRSAVSYKLTKLGAQRVRSCVLCAMEEPSVNGRYCASCVAQAQDLGREYDARKEVLAWLAVTGETRRARAEHLRRKRPMGVIREYERDDIEASAVPLEVDRRSPRFRDAKALVNSMALRYPDGYGGCVWLGKGDLALIPVWSPQRSTWTVFKCDRVGGGRSGRGFSWLPLDYVRVSYGLTLRFDPDEGFERNPGAWDDAETEVRPELFEDYMDDAWDLAQEWKRQLEVAWELDGVEALRDVRPGALVDAIAASIEVDGRFERRGRASAMRRSGVDHE